MNLRSVVAGFCALIIPFGITGCTETELASHVIKQVPAQNASKSKGKFKIGSPYRIKGRKYYPKEMYEYVETGTASWYGPGFHGKSTANGEIFNQNDLTAAHRTLQLPSIIKVTNLDNGRSVILRVNDRGPFAHNRILDVSEKGAEALGFKNAGVANIKLELLPEESRIVADAARSGRDTRGIEIAMNNKYRNNIPLNDTVERLPAPKHQKVAINRYPVPSRSPVTYTRAPVNSVPLPPTQPAQVNAAYNQPIINNAAPTYIPTGNYYVQVASFSSEANAVSFSRTLGDLGPVTVENSTRGMQPIYRVKVGPLSNQQQVDTILPRLVERGHSDAIVLVEN